MHTRIPVRHAAVLVLLATLPGCAALGTLRTIGTVGEILGAATALPGQPRQARLVAQVEHLDARQNLIVVRTQDDRTGGVHYNHQTEVTHRQQPLLVTALQPGDVIEIHLEQVDAQTVLARRIAVVQSVREQPVVVADTQAVAEPAQPDGVAAVVLLAGRVGEIDVERGSFELETDHAGVLTVVLPFSPEHATLERFRGLSRGDAVGIEAVDAGMRRLELRRFLN